VVAHALLQAGRQAGRQVGREWEGGKTRWEMGARRGPVMARGVRRGNATQRNAAGLRGTAAVAAAAGWPALLGAHVQQAAAVFH
jgi:hypothetical protein